MKMKHISGLVSPCQGTDVNAQKGQCRNAKKAACAKMDTAGIRGLAYARRELASIQFMQKNGILMSSGSFRWLE